jgi:hypothetical protein
VESEIRRDLTTLARNNAISDALLVSAEEDLAQVVADVQDLGIRVTIVHITVGGNWTISRSLRQECDDIIEIGEGHLRPFTQLVTGTDSLSGEEPYQLAVSATRALTNGHGLVAGSLGQQALSAGSHPAPPAIYTAPVVAEYQRAAQPGAQPVSAQLPGAQLPGTQLPGGQPGGPPSPLPRREPPGSIERQSMEAARGAGAPSRAPDPGVPPRSAQNLQAASGLQAQPRLSEPQRNPGPNPNSNPAQRQPGVPGQQGLPVQQSMGGVPAQPGLSGPGQQSMAGQQAMQPQSYAPPSPPPQSLPTRGMPGQGAPDQGMQAQQNGNGQQSMAGQSIPGQGLPGQGLPGQQGMGQQGVGQNMPGHQSMPGQHAAPSAPPPSSPPGLPDPRARGAHAQPPANEQNLYQAPPSSFRGPAQDVPSRPYQQGPYGVLPSEQMMPGQPYPPSAPSTPAGSGQNAGSAYVPQQGPYGTPQAPGPQPPAPQAPGPQASVPQTPMPQTPGPQTPMPQSPGQQAPGQPTPVPGQGMPLADAVQAAHAEGFEFGQSVAREAPALWLEAVLARKPRMPSDLEARLLQDSALPIDSLLHDETRHALRRGFWDALERSRR